MKPVSLIIIIGAFVILQYHSINFWLAMSNGWIGWIVSPVIEIASLLFWYKKDTGTAFLLSVVVICASLFHLSKGSIEAWADISKIEAKSSSIDAVNKTLNRIADDKMDWWKTTQKSLDTLVILNGDADNVTKTKPVILLNIIVEGLMLIMILIAQVKSIIILRGNALVVTKETVKPKTETKKNQLRNAFVDTPVSLLAKDTLQALSDFGDSFSFLSERQIRNALRLGDADFSRLRTASKSGEGMSLNKMNMINNRIKEYE